MSKFSRKGGAPAVRTTCFCTCAPATTNRLTSAPRVSPPPHLLSKRHARPPFNRSPRTSPCFATMRARSPHRVAAFARHTHMATMALHTPTHRALSIHYSYKTCESDRNRQWKRDVGR
ncbi:hypothetical protein C8Q78DRAFT_7590 [Trametes maxima]|nr:hypothetical protein C8Q78DRAFT_7590 [Trametes maxima]